MLAKCTVKVDKGRTICQVLNPSSKALRIPKGKPLAVSQPLLSQDVIQSDDLPAVSTLSDTNSGSNNEDPITKFEDLDIDISNSNLSESQEQKLKILIGKNRDVFAKDMSEIGACKSFYHTIDTGDAPPQRQPYYRATPTARYQVQHPQISLETLDTDFKHKMPQ